MASDSTGITPAQAPSDTAFSFSTHPSVQPFRISSAEFLSRHFDRSSKTRPPAPRFLATGAIVFNRPVPTNANEVSTPADQPPRVLLVQRAAHDSMPLKWETPGGACDPEDTSILHACARELEEEAGLVAASVGPVVAVASKTTTTTPVTTAGPDEGQKLQWGETMGGHYFLTRSAGLICKFYFVVGVPEEEAARVKLDPNEHEAFVWAMEEEVMNKKMAGEDGIRLDFTTREQWEVVLEAFKLWKI